MGNIRSRIRHKISVHLHGCGSVVALHSLHNLPQTLQGIFRHRVVVQVVIQHVQSALRVVDDPLHLTCGT